jgi:hypothetical protein
VRKPEPVRAAGISQQPVWTCKGQLGLEDHGARTLPGLGARIGLRLLTLAAGIWNNHLTVQPERAFAAYGR